MPDVGGREGMGCRLARPDLRTAKLVELLKLLGEQEPEVCDALLRLMETLVYRK
jgi:hypothetical protein